jgi:hypothetical protein
VGIKRISDLSPLTLGKGKGKSKSKAIPVTGREGP